MWPAKMKVDWPYSEIGQKMANGQFCALHTTQSYKQGSIVIIVLLSNLQALENVYKRLSLEKYINKVFSIASQLG